VDGEKKQRLLDESWILVNTSVSECLPVSFLEAAAHGCAILSPHDPDGFASRFGFHAESENLEDGLRWLLMDDNWRQRGFDGHRYVGEVHEEKKVINQHIAEYEKMMN
jgi:glycosyltransferase involved in cell wall biosynthesis